MLSADSTFNEEIYFFDTFGYCLIKNFLDKIEIKNIAKTLDLIEQNNYTLNGTDVCLGQINEHGTVFISNIASATPLLTLKAFDPRVLNLLEIFMNGKFKLNHSNAIIAREGSTYPHMAGYPIHNMAFYHTSGQAILSSLTKLVVPISNNTADSGGFAIVKGSHKASFAIPYASRSSQEHELLEFVKLDPGDALLFTEAMTHGSLTNKSGKKRKMIFYCYSLDYMPQWPTQNVHISDRFKQSLPESLHKYV